MKNWIISRCLLVLTLSFLLGQAQFASAQESPKQLDAWLKRFPRADANGDGKLSNEEADAFRKRLQTARDQRSNRNQGGGAVGEFTIDPGWDAEKFPDHAVSYKSPEEIKAIYAKQIKGNQPAVVSFGKPESGAMRIVGTGHSFMAPGYKTLPKICEAAGFTQPLHTHTGGGVKGGPRYKWEQENGIFEFDGKPFPKLLASIANADWEAMMWAPYSQARPEFYTCWIDFCKKYHPEMKFFLSDNWPTLRQIGEIPEIEDYFTEAVMDRLAAEKNERSVEFVQLLRKDNPGKVFILPTSDAMVLAVKYYLRGELPGVEGIHRVIGKKERSLWRDQIGHLGPGFERLEGYVFYATLYGRSPELIERKIDFEDEGDFPSPELDRMFRKIAWQAVINHPLSGVTDRDGNGIGD